jgi:sortase A
VLSRILGGVGRVLVVAGLFILGFVAFQLWGTSIEESRNQGDLTDAFAQATDAIAGVNVDVDDTPTNIARALSKVDAGTAPPTPVPEPGSPVGIIQIDRIGLTRVFVSGVSKEELKQGPGHYRETPLPGQPGNAGIAGHRTTYGAPFNRIDELQVGDKIVVSTAQGQFTYTVIPAPGAEQAWYVVAPSDVSVLADQGDNRITLTACHPKYSAKERIIVHAVLDTPPAAASAAPTDAAGTTGESAAAAFDESLEGDPDALGPALLFGIGAALVLLGAAAVARWWRRGWAWAIGTPAVLVLVWFCYVNLDRYLPAL